ncbi:ATP-dependent RNA helicase DDX24 [Lucilia cuprina]|uniref:ATP-dependent RNA helicase DDX24 n=1 Tax=Lucilia cuprina TaxID=7375 RepID=UPI001F059AA5|nr:ATP-dependent RNA helicase DDX24 [Lucilia cuprina]
MVQNKQKSSKIKPPSVKVKKEAAKAAEKKWEKVKIKGSVITEDGVGLEGLIGLEVLEDYDNNLIGTAKPKLSRKEKRMERKKGSKKAKVEVGSDEDNSEEESSDESDNEVNDKAGRKKAKKEDYLSRKLEKRREKREQRKLKRKESKQQSKNKEENKNMEKKSQKAKDKTNKKEKQTEDRFKLLRPPPSAEDEEDLKSQDSEEEEEEEDAAPELVDSKAISIDDLEGWNGLGVPHNILQALAEKGFKSPTEIQSRTLAAAILGKKDILGAAETGSGKTLAFGIPMLTGIMELKRKNARTGIRKPMVKAKNKKTDVKELNKEELEEEQNLEIDNMPEFNDSDEEESGDEKGGALYALVLTPTRELAVQVKDHLVAAAKYTGIKVAAIFGGLSLAKQERVLNQHPEIVVATPGRLWELYQQGNKHLSKIEDISFLAIDETDRMVEKGHFEELRTLLRVINENEEKKQSRQNFIFSATLTLVHDLPEHMQRRNYGKRPKFVKQTSEMKIQSFIEELGISQPKIVDITSSQQTAQTLTECRLICPLEHKDYYLYYFVQRHPGRTIVFCNSIDCVKRLSTLFGLLQCNPLPLHANMIQKQRLKNLERFRDDVCGLLIATDVAARGLDIPNVEHVIHYQVPRTSENYVHRSGRTARANKNGITVMFMEPGEVKTYIKLYKTLERTEDLPLFPVSERYLNAVKERVNLAREVDKQELKLKRTQTELGWMKKHAEEMDMVIEGFNDDEGSDQDEDPFIIEKRRNRVQLDAVRAELKTLLSTPIFPRGFSFKYPSVNTQLTDMSGENIDEAQSAVKVMKDAIEDMKQAKKMRNKKRKSS